MDTDPAGGLGRVDLQYQPYQSFVDVSRSGVPGYTEIYTSEIKFVPFTGLAGFTPEVFRAVQHVKAQGSSYGDLKAMASVSLGARGVGVTSPQGSISAGVKITSSDKIRYYFKPTASKRLPDSLVINLSLDAIFETQALRGTLVRETNPGSGVYAQYPYTASTFYEGSVIATAQGPKAYYVDEIGNPAPMGRPAQSYMQVVPGSFVGGEGTITLSDTLQLFVQPEYTLPADQSAPFLVTQEFKIGLQSMAVSAGGKSLADASNTLLIDSITFPDGSTPESQGYQLEFESGHLSPNLRQVPEPASATLAVVTLILAYAAGRQRRR